MKIIIDTNIWVSSLSSRSKHHWVIEFFMEERFDLVVSHEILLEYEEILKLKYGVIITENFLRSIKDAPNVEYVDIHFNWKLLADHDDDKFVDAYISSGADFLVTEDSDFKLLKDLEFPIINVLKFEEFKSLF